MKDARLKRSVPKKSKVGENRQMIPPYQVAICQAEQVAFRAGGVAKHKENMATNLRRYCDLIDETCTFVQPRFKGLGGGTRLITFGEFAITGGWAPAESGQDEWGRKEIIKYLTIRIPGEETEVLAKKARQYGVYIAAVNLESDPEWPDFFFNTGFIINPGGKIILKYQKTLTNNMGELSCCAHDIMRAYRNPITKKYDPFPVVETSIGRLAIMICADIGSPEIPRIYSMKGADVVLFLTRSGSHSGGTIRPPGVYEAVMQSNAFQNAVYFVNSNWGPTLGARHPRAIGMGSSKVYDYTGRLLVQEVSPDETIVRAEIDIEAARRYKQIPITGNRLIQMRAELYAPYYNKTIYPPNTFLDEGPIDKKLEDKHVRFMKKAIENLNNCQDYYKESDV